MTNLRVLIELNNADLRIGAVNDALDLAELAAPQGVDFLLCGPLTCEFCEEARQRGIQTASIRSRAFSRRGLPLYAIDVLAWILRLAKWRPDVVHLNYSGWGPSLACASYICGIPVVARAGGPVISENLSNRWVSAYVANCQAHAADLLSSPLASRVVITGDLFRPDRVRSTMGLERTLPPKKRGVARLVFLGQLVERKAIDVLIDAFSRVGSAAELLIVGGEWNAPGYPQRLKAMAEKLGVASRIHFENHRQDVGAILSAADVFVLPSFSEARPRSIIEAMSLGVPIVASDVGGIPSLVTHKKTGLLVPAGDPGALAVAIDHLLQSSSLREQLGEAGRKRVEQDCRPDRSAIEYVRLYQDLATARGTTENLESVLIGELRGTVQMSPRCKVLLQRESLRFDRDALRAALVEASAGDYIAYAIALTGSPATRLSTLATLPSRLRKVDVAMARGDAQVVAKYGVDPRLDSPSCVYELNTPASEYADRCLRTRGFAPAMRRILSRWLPCDPALGGVIIVGRKS